MLLIKTRVGPSSIHGNGVFSCEDVAAGTQIWRFLPPFDATISDDALRDLPDAVRAHLDHYAYRSAELGGQLVLPGDNAKFLNHSSNPNTQERSLSSIASKPIAEGDEITCDYGAFCLDWPGIEAAEDGSPAQLAAPILPHDGLYARLQACKHGVGVFAIRDIPEGAKIFAADRGATARVPVITVETLHDAELRRMYYDFCPVVDGAFLAPAHFDQLTMGWYTNHSDKPNIYVDAAMEFTALEAIAKGEELTTNYTTYSEHAHRFSDKWRLADVSS